MPEQAMTDATRREDAAIEARLQAAWRRQRRLASSIGACAVLAVVVAALAVAFVIDWHYELPPPGRLALLATIALAVALTGYAAWWRWLRPYDAARVAIQVEALHPELTSVLVSHVQLRDRAGAAQAGSADMIRALASDAAARTRGIEFGRIVDFRRLRRPAAWCVAALGAAVLWTVLRPELVGAFVRRLLDPTSALRYPTRTVLTPLVADCHVQEGARLVLAVRAEGVVPATGTLTIREADGTVHRHRLPAGEPDAAGRREFAHVIDAVYDDLRFSFAVGDARTTPATVTASGPPAVTPVIEVTPPSYTGREPRRVESLSAEAPEGSTVAWRLALDRPVAAADMILEDGAAVPLAVSADGLEAILVQEPVASFRYGLRWKDRDHGFVHASSVRHAIEIVPDAPPRVLLVTPSRDLKATPRKQLDVAFECEDDHGVAAAWIVYTIENAPADEAVEERIEIPLAAASDRRGLEAGYRWNVAESLSGLEPGDVVRLAVEVQDGRPGRPWTSRSEPRRLTVLSIQEYAASVIAERDRLLMQLKHVYDEERDAVGDVEQLQREQTP